MTIETYPYDSADYLDDQETLAHFAEEVLAEDDPKLRSDSVRVIVRALGLTALAGSSGVPRRSLVKALSGEDPGGAALLEKVLRATIRPATSHAAE